MSLPTIPQWAKDIGIPLLSAAISAAVVFFFGLPVVNARNDERIKALENGISEIETQVTNMSMRVSKNGQDILLINNHINEAQEFFDRTNASIADFQNRLVIVESRLEAIGSANPVTNECAEIMKNMRSPGNGMAHFSRDPETGQMRDSRQVSLLERFNDLGCNK